MALYGITIVNEGQVMSTNDIYTENTYQFFATNVDYLDSVTGVVSSTRNISAASNIPTRVTTTGTPSTTTGESETGTTTETPTESTTSDDTPSAKTLSASSIIEAAYESTNPRLKKYEAIVQSAKEGYLYKVDDNNEVVLDLKEGKKQTYDASQASTDFNNLQDKQIEDIFSQWKRTVYDPAVLQLCNDYSTTEEALESMLAGTDGGALQTKLKDKYLECYNTYKYYKYTFNRMKQTIEQAENILVNTYRAKINVPSTDETTSDTDVTKGDSEEGEQPTV